MKKYCLLVFVLTFSHSIILGQEGENEKETKRHQVGVLLGHTHMRSGEVDASSKRLSLPSTTLFYNYHFNEKWSLGLHTDFVAENFVAESLTGEGNSVERTRPVAPAIMVGYKPGEHFTFLFGGGIDIAKEETLVLLRFDVEYGLEIKDGWEFITTLGYDARFDAYDSLQLGVGIAKSFN